MGYGRSGSTLLDIILGDNKHIVTTGALDNYHIWVNKNLKCACDKKIRECEYWGLVYKDTKFSDDDIKLVREMDSFRSFFTVNRKKFHQNVKKYIRLNNTLLKSITTHFRKNVIVDSSKTTLDCIYRPIMFLKYCNVDLKPIFLIRNPRGVVWSAMKKHGSPERDKKDTMFFRFLRTLISWNLTNLLTILITKVFLKEFLFIKYEDFCKNPINELLRIKKFTKSEIDNVANKITNQYPIDIGHNIGGNRLRFAKSIDSIQLDESWKENMPKFYFYIVTIISYPLIKYFKY